jgi:hypothetical protein
MSVIEIKDGGQLERVGKPKLRTMKFNLESGSIALWINGDSLTHLSLKEARDLRNALNKTMSDYIDFDKTTSN